MNTDKFCQSCAMPLQDKHTDNRGTEANGSKSNKYCSFCYQRGKFTNPKISYDEMLKIGLDGIERNPKMNKFSKWIMKKTYPGLLSKMSRWS